MSATDRTDVKQDVRGLLDKLPDQCSYEDVQYHLYVLEKIKNSEKRARDEGAISHEEVKRRLQKWRMK